MMVLAQRRAHRPRTGKLPLERSASENGDSVAVPQSTGTKGKGLALVVSAVGVVFGDLATSPLYTLQECLSGPHGVTPTHENIYGSVSLVVWSLILVVSVKYI